MWASFPEHSDECRCVHVPLPIYTYVYLQGKFLEVENLLQTVYAILMGSILRTCTILYFPRQRRDSFPHPRQQACYQTLASLIQRGRKCETPVVLFRLPLVLSETTSPFVCLKTIYIFPSKNSPLLA